MQKFPKQYIEASATKSEHSKKIEAKTKLRGETSIMTHIDDAGLYPSQVKARIDMSAEVAGSGLCPECRKPMVKAYANEIPVLSCNDCRIAIPMPNVPEVDALNKDQPESRSVGQAT